MLEFNADLPLIDDFAALFLDDMPMMDVRAPVEFRQGAFPAASNHPLLNDEERHRIGICYKENGQDQAVRLGIELVNDQVRQLRVTSWAEFVNANPHGVLYCFRGGMRSKISQQWIYEHTGIMYPRVKGGYKAMRRYLLESSERLIAQTSFVVLSGRTGSGKTWLLNQLDDAIDLEGLANHRGSAFGTHATPQPEQINFENSLAIRQLKLEHAGISKVVLEDEGRNIGSVHLPFSLQAHMKEAPLVLLEEPLEQRIQVIVQDYTVDLMRQHIMLYGEETGFKLYSEALLRSLDKIRKRLGGERHKALRELMEQALWEQQKTNSPQSHIGWVSRLLTDYYDPMYDYQLDKKSHRIVFSGNREAVIDYLTGKN